VIGDFAFEGHAADRAAAKAFFAVVNTEECLHHFQSVIFTMPKSAMPTAALTVFQDQVEVRTPPPPVAPPKPSQSQPPQQPRETDRRAIGDETRTICLTGEYRCGSERVDIRRLLEQTEVLLVPPDRPATIPTPRPESKMSEIKITPKSTIEVVRRLAPRPDDASEKVRVAALVFGSLDDHETLYREGYSGQEIDIAYASNTHSKAVMDELEDMYKVGDPPEGTDYIAVTKKAVVFRDHELKLAQPCVASFITAVAPNYERLLFARGEVEARKVLDERIARILVTAHSSGFNVLVLGAFGCGNRRNPPEIVAEIFNDYLVNKQLGRCFREIVFAIYTPPEPAGDSAVLNAFTAVFP
jgi:uncharacterized protein (TIGR02452 family)